VKIKKGLISKYVINIWIATSQHVHRYPFGLQVWFPNAFGGHRG